MSESNKVFQVNNLSFYYGGTTPTLKNLTFGIEKNSITALIGPSGCGKTTLIRAFNRMHDLYPNNRYEGEILFHGNNILAPEMNLIELRSRVGMVFQKPAPFPMSIFDNVAYGLRLNRMSKARIKDKVEEALQGAALWNEVKDRLNQSGYSLSGGQQQRLVIARALAVDPEVLLLDEATSALDPNSTAKIEELALELKKTVTILIVTHNLQQAARISDYTAFLMLGELIEYGKTFQMFTAATNKLTEDYITGRFG